MKVEEIEGVKTFHFDPFKDERGVWQRVWDKGIIGPLGFTSEVAQASISVNPLKGTLRGLHYLIPSVGETKTVFCVSGAVQDVVLDVRANSQTFSDYVDLRLGPGQGVAVSPGMAHGFLSLEPNTLLVYVMSAPYSKESERTIRWNDPSFGIDWLLDPKFISDKDSSASDFF